jgi:hypothetical protein
MFEARWSAYTNETKDGHTLAGLMVNVSLPAMGEKTWKSHDFRYNCAIRSGKCQFAGAVFQSTQLFSSYGPDDSR